MNLSTCNAQHGQIRPLPGRQLRDDVVPRQPPDLIRRWRARKNAVLPVKELRELAPRHLAGAVVHVLQQVQHLCLPAKRRPHTCQHRDQLRLLRARSVLAECQGVESPYDALPRPGVTLIQM